MRIYIYVYLYKEIGVGIGIEIVDDEVIVAMFGSGICLVMIDFNEDSAFWDPRGPVTGDSQNMEFGNRRRYAALAFLRLWSWRTDIFQLSGFYRIVPLWK